MIGIRVSSLEVNPLNEYLIRNGFSEIDASMVLKMKSATRDYANTEYLGRVHALITRPARKPRGRQSLLNSRRKGHSRLVLIEAALPTKS